MPAANPDFLWAQRKDKVFITVDVPNFQKAGATIKITDAGTVFLKGKGGPEEEEHEYVLDIETAQPIKAEESKCNIGARNVQFQLVKAEPGPYWDHLLKSGKNMHCKIDWALWKDEDEEDDHDMGATWNDKDMADLSFGNDADDGDDDSSEGDMPDLVKEEGVMKE